MSKEDNLRFSYDPVAALRNAPKLMGMELTECGKNKLCGAYYINGDRHNWRRDKLKCFIWNGRVFVAEEGGQCMSLENWLIQYGGCADYKEALRVIKGQPQAIEWNREFRQMNAKKMQYVPNDVLQGAKCYDLRLSPLFSWLCTIFPEDSVREVFLKYNVTANQKHQTVFWYLDSDGHICHDKKIFFREDGHRDKEMPMGRDYRVGDGYSARTLFGANLIPDSGDICCLESEKSALICALVYPDKCWVACGGKSNLRGISERFVLYPDLDAISDWSGTKGRIEEWWLDWGLPIEQRPKNADFADMIVWEKTKKI